MVGSAAIGHEWLCLLFSHNGLQGLAIGSFDTHLFHKNKVTTNIHAKNR